MEMQDKSNLGFAFKEKNEFSKEIETQDRDKVPGTKSETMSYMQDDYTKNYLDGERKFLQVLSNTKTVYDYPLLEEYLLQILKENDLAEYMEEYLQLLENNGIDYRKCIIELGESSLQRFLTNHEKRVFEFPPPETEKLMIIRNGECSSDLRLNKKQK